MGLVGLNRRGGADDAEQHDGAQAARHRPQAAAGAEDDGEQQRAATPSKPASMRLSQSRLLPVLPLASVR
jgi:hypothetical protein